ncbi:MAG: sigma-70 family RNA polymerase sigma factor [Planctomycetota bacterium]
MAHSQADGSEQPSVDEFVQLFAQHQRRVHAYIGTVLPSRGDADDVMQETSIALWKKWGEFDRSRDFFRWACGIARIEVLRYRRKHATQRLFLEEKLMESIADEAIRQAQTVDLRGAALEHCLTKLNDDSRQLIEYRYGQGVTALQTATDLGRPPSTVYKALARIRKTLLECIRRRMAEELHR